MKNLIQNAAKAASTFAIILAFSGLLLAQSKETPASASPSGTTQTVNAVQSGLWNVGIDPARSNVRVSNAATDPVQVEVVKSKDKQLHQIKIPLVVVGAGPSSSTETSVAIPDGKRFVIESVSAYAEIPAGEHVALSILTFGDGTSGSWSKHFVPLTDQGTFGTNAIYTANFKTLILGGYRVYFSARPSYSGANGSSMLTLSGYLEDMPTTP